ncbi:MCE family protein [Nocardioides marmoriginsengisoli]|uniref:MCE family protein n=1 Tax=Nocardioides marmoriginsengisoli TaxID=661483 RepID=A0A3N0CPJ3_9ACTN|nr:MlaD family protein [Nocardioides marmoriginsengisoli]RNL64813.1 MCE family protein [Nocardioides marmoriginsengisoli]
MGTRNTATTVAAVKLGIFTACSLVVTTVLAMIMGNFGFGSTTEYKALFSSASLISKGDDVRIAGLTVGSVKDVKIYDKNNALVTFDVKSDVPLTTASKADIRFLNLVGDRYMSISQGAPGAPSLKEDGTIPMAQTTPALDLTALFNGFQPLFQALDPDQINELSLNLVKVLQGEGGTIAELLSRTASLTNTLADRDELIGDVITNLSTMLKTVDDHHQQLDDLVVQLKDWLGNLSVDRKLIGTSLTNVSALTGQLSDLLTRGRPLLREDIKQLGRVANILARPKNQAILNEALDRLPELFRKQARIGTYGSWYNYYLCDFTGKIILPKIDLSTLGIPDLTGPLIKQLEKSLSKALEFHSTADRCS